LYFLFIYDKNIFVINSTISKTEKEIKKMKEANQEITAPKETIISWGQFVQAMEIFGGDYAIVGHTGEPTISPFAKPRDYGMYSLTQLPSSIDETGFKKEMEKIDKVVITCMDKRVARPVWEKEGGMQGNVFILAIGGGVVQDGLRQEKMETIAQYLSQFKNIRQVVATDHEHVCGAAKYFLKRRGYEHRHGVCGLLNKDPGCAEEKATMDQLIAFGVKAWQKAFGKDKVVAKNAIIKEEAEDVEMILVDLESVTPMSIADLVDQYSQNFSLN
jgi:carbonic anhydrase